MLILNNCKNGHHAICLRAFRAEVAELVDAHDSKSCSFGSEGSIPSFGTKKACIRPFSIQQEVWFDIFLKHYLQLQNEFLY